MGSNFLVGYFVIRKKGLKFLQSTQNLSKFQSKSQFQTVTFNHIFYLIIQLQFMENVVLNLKDTGTNVSQKLHTNIHIKYIYNYSYSFFLSDINITDTHSQTHTACACKNSLNPDSTLRTAASIKPQGQTPFFSKVLFMEFLHHLTGSSQKHS